MQVHSFIYDKDVVNELFKETRKMYTETEEAKRGFFNRNSGYTSVKVDEENPVRRGDGTVMARISFMME
jgi:ribosomal protein L17